MSLFISRTFRQGSESGQAWPPGKVPVASPLEARQVGAQLAPGGGATETGEPGPTAGEIAALALLDDSYQAILDHHLGERDATLMDRVLVILRAQLGQDLLDRLLVDFAEEYLGARMTGLALMLESRADSGGADLDRTQVLRQILVFWLVHQNPAARPIVSSIHTANLLEVPAFRQVVDLMTRILEREPGVVDDEASLWDLLIMPQKLSPDSLSGQLSHLKEIWSKYLEDSDGRLDLILGMLAEEQKPQYPPGPGPSEVPRFRHEEDEVRFSADQSWMSGLVLVAKHTLVWLHQLSSSYDRPIERLDQIPDTELERLSKLGFNGLWLIGVWQRSPVSQRIKELCGNHEAAPSAYSIVRYEVADQLGGEEALSDLRRRAQHHGLRLAADMVPNHTGLDSDWMVHHPDWFIGQETSPFPAYSFAGENLSTRPEIGVYLEDHYYDRSDAAVVFKRQDTRTGQVRYIYHGNDGTSMPWNDTAQLDYLNPEVWSEVIDTIVAVAKRFPVIRFDAAMTLTRRHFQRLWYPPPGSAGDIPSRAEHGIAPESFPDVMPKEFWREVVDRVAAEAPDTLLLAEAFWLMEGFFVRTLGMHRVYNSAFMNMLRDGETEKFRHLIRETLEFDPGILGRYVNFMSNPDERSAIEQFGDGDRYFGTCVVMSTLPGLPMFGHGQVEGLSERYGMEYRRSYYEEWTREDLVERHLKQIAPLLEARDLFADVENFRLYDLRTADGQSQNDVLAYSNGSPDHPVLVIFNNSDYRARGRLQVSAPFRRQTDAGESHSATVEIHQALGVPPQGYVVAKDSFTDLQFLFDATSFIENGMEIDLAAWECRVLTGFDAADMDLGLAGRLHAQLGLRGSYDLERTRREIELEPFRRALGLAMDEDLLQRLIKVPGGLSKLSEKDELLEELQTAVEKLAKAVGGEETRATDRLLALTTLPDLARRLTASKTKTYRRAGTGVQGALDRRPEVLPTLYCWVLLTLLQDCAAESDAIPISTDWRLESSVMPGLIAAGGEPDTVRRLLSVLRQALRTGWGRQPVAAPEALDLQRQLLADEQLRQTLGVNQFEGQEYISQESLESLVDLRLLLEAQAWSAGPGKTKGVPAAVSEWWQVLHQLAADAEASAYCTGGLGIAEVAVTPVTES